MRTKIFYRYIIIFFVLLLLSLLLILKSRSNNNPVPIEPKGSEWNYSQLQKIDKSKNNFSFAVFGDNRDSVEVFENLIAKLNNDNILFAVDDGDLVSDGENEEFISFLDQIKNLNKPLFTVLGNHEIKEEGRTTYQGLFGKFYYSYFVGDSYFIVLDDANKKNIDDEQFVWLKKELEISQKYQNRFVFMHVPLYDPRKGDYKKGHSLKDLNFAKKLNNLFDKNNVTMLFLSHIHGYYDGSWGKTPYIITGGGGAELAGSDPEHYFYHYIKVSIDNNSVEYNIIKLKESDF